MEYTTFLGGNMYSTQLLADRRPTPAMWRLRFYLAVLTIVFTMLEIWATIVVLTTVRASGASGTAMFVQVFGAGFAVVLGWGLVLRLDRNHAGPNGR